MTLKPLGDRVLVKPAPKEEKTATGLYISSGAQEKPQRGEVIAVGAGKVNDHGERIALDVKVGDQIEIAFGARTLRVEVLAVAEAVRKDDASAMYKEI